MMPFQLDDSAKAPWTKMMVMSSVGVMMFSFISIIQ